MGIIHKSDYYSKQDNLEHEDAFFLNNKSTDSGEFVLNHCNLLFWFGNVFYWMG